MTRLRGVPPDCKEPADLLSAIRSRRGGRLLHLDRALLHSEPLARAWNSYLGCIRGSLTITPLLRELAICGVAILNGAEYEFQQHEPEFRRAGGTARAAGHLRHFEYAAGRSDVFNEAERAVIMLAIQMTRAIKVDDQTWLRVQSSLPDPQAQVEIVAIIATYNMVSRFLVACQIEPEAE